MLWFKSGSVITHDSFSYGTREEGPLWNTTVHGQFPVKGVCVKPNDEIDNIGISDVIRYST